LSLDKNAVQNAALGKRSTVCELPCLWLQQTQLCDEVAKISMLRANMYTSCQHCLMPFHFRYRNNTLPGTFVTTMRTYASALRVLMSEHMLPWPFMHIHMGQATHRDATH
jgi:hypothetical protein